jgi:nitrile hydratase beta subunit
MNGVHDMGGMTHFGPLQIEPNEPIFHAEWERRVRGLVNELIANENRWDQFRFAIERIDPVVYLSAGYYERWLTGLERHLVEVGTVTPEEMASALEGWEPKPGRPFPREIQSRPEPAGDRATPQFQAGDRVVARVMNPPGHTRIPRYVRGKPGTVERLLGIFALPDSNALNAGEHPEPCYAVRFAATDLWGKDASSRDSVCVDLWESYLRRA